MGGMGMRKYTLGHETTVLALQQAPLFYDLDGEDVRSLAAIATRHAYMESDLILAPNYTENFAFVVTHGTVRRYLVSPDRELNLPPQGVGEVFELSQIDFDSGDVVAQALEDNTEIYCIPWERLLSVVRLRPAAVSVLTEVLRQRMRDEERLLKELAFHTTRARLAHVLVELADSATNTVTATHQELAAVIGSRSEEVTKALKQLCEEGLVDREPHRRRHIQVLERYHLANYGREPIRK